MFNGAVSTLNSGFCRENVLYRDFEESVAIIIVLNLWLAIHKRCPPGIIVISITYIFEKSGSMARW